MAEIFDHNGRPVQHGRARVNGIRMHYVTAGRGEPLLLLHGTPKTYRAGLKNGRINTDLKQTKLTLPVMTVGAPEFFGPPRRSTDAESRREGRAR